MRSRLALRVDGSRVAVRFSDVLTCHIECSRVSGLYVQPLYGCWP